MTLFGHDRQGRAIQAALAASRVHHAWLLAGPQGVGKASFARRVAARILAEDSGTAPLPPGLSVPEEHPTARLLSAGSHPDFRIIERMPNEKTGNLARNITVDQVRALRALFSTGTAIAERRVVLIDSADDLERGAANALLKGLEEPPSNTIFLLVSHQPGRLLPTIRSRCRTLVFNSLSDDDMTSVLAIHRPELAQDERLALVAAAGGLPATALAYLELDMPLLDGALAEVARTGDATNAIRSRLAQSLALKAATPRYEAFLQRAPAFIATHARGSSGAALGRALTAWSQARSLAQIAVPQSLIPETVVFEMTGYVASLAADGAVAKA